MRTAQGSDDFLGRLRIPMAQILQQRGAELNQRLEDWAICDSENSPALEFSGLLKFTEDLQAPSS